MDTRRRQAIAAGIGFGTALLPLASGARAAERTPKRPAPLIDASEFGLRDNSRGDQTKALQAGIDTAAAAGSTLYLPPGTYRVTQLRLPAGARLLGAGPRSLIAGGNRPVLVATAAAGIRLNALAVRAEGGRDNEQGIVTLRDCADTAIDDCRVTGGRNGIVLYGCGGRIAGNEVTGIAGAGIFSRDAKGLEIAGNHVHRCGNNGIQVWRSEKGSDATLVAGNRIEHIAATDGGSGENGNGINAFRAADVIVSGNRIAHCAYSAVRANASSNVLIVGNSCANLGEVAIYAEFGFEGAVIASNVIERAASGIEVTNFNEGGRLAVVQGNLVRDLFVRDHPDRRGIGIFVEADTQVSGNVVENAPVIGICIGWGRYLRDVAVTGNIVREAGVGIGISDSRLAGQALITGNLIAGTRAGAIRSVDGDKPVGIELASAGAVLPANLSIANNRIR